MKSALHGNGSKRRYRLRFLWLLAGLTLAAGSIVGAAWVLRSRDGNRVSQEGRGAVSSPESRGPAVVCIGVVDVEGGVLSLHPPLPGRVAEVPVRENETVRADTVLLRLEDELARLQVREAEAAVQAAEAQLAEAREAPRQHQFLLAQQKAALAAAQHELAAARLLAARKQRLVKSEFVAQEEADAAQEMVKKLEAAERAEQAKLAALQLRDPLQDVTRAEADVLAKQATRDKARYSLRQHALKAPVGGTVLRLLINPGEVLGPERRHPAVLFCPDKPWIIRAEVEQEFAGRLAVGQPALIQDQVATTGPTWKGQVKRIADWYGPRRTVLPETLPLQEVRTVECIIQFDSGQPPMRIGQRVRVTLGDK
jgi:multidrug resistance efflux pump